MHFFLHLAPDAKWGRTWDSFQALLAMLSCTIYVVNTYAPADECTLMPEQAGLVVELVTSALFTSDYVLQLFLAKRRIRHVLSLVALAELLTVLPIFLALAAEGLISAAEIAGCSSSFAFARFLRLTRFLRIVRLGRFFRNQRRTPTPSRITRPCWASTSSRSCSSRRACSSGWRPSTTTWSCRSLDNDVELPFHIALYYMLIEVYA